MQFTKDSFYMALLQRMTSLYPLQTITLNGTTRPAIVVAENEPVIPIVPLPDAFYLEWGIAQPVAQQSGNRMLLGMDCLITHHTFGSTDSGFDRGRSLTSLDLELLAICQPQYTSKLDYTQTPAANLGTNIFWTPPQFGEITGSEALRNEGLLRGDEGVRLERTAKLRVFFFSEVTVL
jgi:hypothetical protein